MYSHVTCILTYPMLYHHVCTRCIESCTALLGARKSHGIEKGLGRVCLLPGSGKGVLVTGIPRVVCSGGV